MNNVSPIKITGPESETFKKLQEELEKRLEDSENFIPQNFLGINEVKEIKKELEKELKEYIDVRKKAIDEDKDVPEEIKYNFNEEKMEEIVKIFKDTVSNYFGMLNTELPEEEKREAILNHLNEKEYKEGDKPLLFNPALDQEIYTEYDILLFANINFIDRDFLKKVIRNDIKHDIVKAHIYLDLIDYKIKNEDIVKYIELKELLDIANEEIKNAKKEKSDFVIDSFNNYKLKEYKEKGNDYRTPEYYFKLYEEEIAILAPLFIEGEINEDFNNDDIERIIDNMTVDTMEEILLKDGLHKNYYYLDTITIEEFSTKEDIKKHLKENKIKDYSVDELYNSYNEEIFENIKNGKEIVKRLENKEIDYFVKVRTNEDVEESDYPFDTIIITSQKRKDIEIIKKVFIEFLKQKKLFNLIDYSYIHHFIYPNDEEKVEEFIKLK